MSDNQELREDLNRASRALDRVRRALEELQRERDGLTQAAAMLRDLTVHVGCLGLGPDEPCAEKGEMTPLERAKHPPESCERARRFIGAPKGQLALLTQDRPAVPRMVLGTPPIEADGDRGAELLHDLLRAVAKGPGVATEKAYLAALEYMLALERAVAERAT